MEGGVVRPADRPANVELMREVRRMLNNHFSGKIMLNIQNGTIANIQPTPTITAKELNPNLHLTPEERRAIR